jgi:hypothetical protein
VGSGNRPPGSPGLPSLCCVNLTGYMPHSAAPRQLRDSFELINKYTIDAQPRTIVQLAVWGLLAAEIRN